MVFTNVYNPRSAIIRKDQYRETIIRKGATLGANCTIICGTTVGRHAFVAAGAVVNRDVAPFALVAGVPAKRIGWMCPCGVQLPKRIGSVTCKSCEHAYRIDLESCVPKGSQRSSNADGMDKLRE
jgi:UDP-2-acetamido-3-amino-2,3-dideoxy-glucuronate N-acetyltransferase